MSKTTEHENIEKINKLIDEMEKIDEQREGKRNEILALLRKRYPSSDRNTIHIFQYELNDVRLGDIGTSIKGYTDPRKYKGYNRLRRSIDGDKFVVIPRNE